MDVLENACASGGQRYWSWSYTGLGCEPPNSWC